MSSTPSRALRRSSVRVLRILPSGVLSVRKSGGSELTRSTAALVADGAYHHVVAVKAAALRTATQTTPPTGAGGVLLVSLARVLGFLDCV